MEAVVCLSLLLALLRTGFALWVQEHVWDAAETGRQPSRAGSAGGAAFPADVLLAWGSAGLRQDVPVLQRAESIEISHRLGMSESSYEFLGKRIWQWQDLLAGRSTLLVETAPRCPTGSAGAEPSINGAVWLHQHLPLQNGAGSAPTLNETTTLLVHCFYCC